MFIFAVHFLWNGFEYSNDLNKHVWCVFSKWTMCCRILWNVFQIKWKINWLNDPRMIVWFFCYWFDELIGNIQNSKCYLPNESGKIQLKSNENSKCKLRLIAMHETHEMLFVCLLYRCVWERFVFGLMMVKLKIKFKKPPKTKQILLPCSIRYSNAHQQSQTHKLTQFFCLNWPAHRL